MAIQNDLQDAVKQGIISQEQFDKLNAAPSEAEFEEALDEAPRFIRSFGDFFIAIGTGFLGAGLSAAVGFAGGTAIAILGAMVVIWLAAEWLTGYLRISAPSIVLASLFTGFAAYHGPALIAGALGAAEFHHPYIASAICALIAALVFYARFRLPFSVAIFGFTIVGLFLALTHVYAPDIFASDFRWIIGFSGIVLFIAAMWFDVQDPMRKSRLSDCGFWLHLIAAPMLTHSILWDSHPAITSVKSMLGTINQFNSWVIIGGLFLLFGLVALVINRRALLVSSLGYVGSVIAYGIWQLDLPVGAATSVVLISIAGLILTFGVGWKPLRRLIFSALPHGKYLDKLPPAHA